MSELYLASMYLEQGDRENAARELERILSMDMDNIHAWRLLAHALTNPDEIRECWDNVLRLNPRDPEAIAALKALENRSAYIEGTPPPFPEEDMQALEKGIMPALEEEDAPSLEYRIATEATRPVPPRTGDEFAYLERNTQPRAEGKPEKGFFENDFIFYTLIFLVLLFIAIIATLVFFGPQAFDPLFQWLKSLGIPLGAP